MLLKDGKSASTGAVGVARQHDQLLGLQIMGSEKGFELGLGNVVGQRGDLDNLGLLVLEQLEKQSRVGGIGKDIGVSKCNQVLHDVYNSLGVVDARVEIASLSYSKGLAHLFQRKRLENYFRVMSDPFGSFFLEIEQDGLAQVDGELDAFVLGLAGQLNTEIPGAVCDEAEGLALVKNLAGDE